MIRNIEVFRYFIFNRKFLYVTRMIFARLNLDIPTCSLNRVLQQEACCKQFNDASRRERRSSHCRRHRRRRKGCAQGAAEPCARHQGPSTRQSLAGAAKGVRAGAWGWGWLVVLGTVSISMSTSTSTSNSMSMSVSVSMACAFWPCVAPPLVATSRTYISAIPTRKINGIVWYIVWASRKWMGG